jgi:DNA polymerase-3 subunit epsilon
MLILTTEFYKQNFDVLATISIQSTLCTVELSQKLLEQLSQFGKLVRALGIPMRHRASGDALATVKLFKMLLDKDLEKLLSQGPH